MALVMAILYVIVIAWKRIPEIKADIRSTSYSNASDSFSNYLKSNLIDRQMEREFYLRFKSKEIEETWQWAMNQIPVLRGKTLAKNNPRNEDLEKLLVMSKYGKLPLCAIFAIISTPVLDINNDYTCREEKREVGRCIMRLILENLYNNGIREIYVHEYDATVYYDYRLGNEKMYACCRNEDERNDWFTYP